jgi:TDG/mug DNA glycosylase family protein
MSHVKSFPPVAAPSAQVLILGSMPGTASLAAGQYYAHPYNHFWKIMGELAGAGIEMPYATRLEILKTNKIALWDVLESCVRKGSLDSDITKECVNNFPAFFKSHRHITRVFFNGTGPEKFFMKHAAPALAGHKLTFTRLPSTSPANATWSFERKLEVWREIIS